MKKLFALVAIVTCSLSAYAQGPNTSAEAGNGKISGTVVDSVGRTAVEYATVALLKMTGDSPVNGSVCDDKGRFTIKDIAPGQYRVVVSFIGYRSKTITVTVPERNNDIDLGTIQLSVTAEILKEITIEGQKAMIEERVDRTIYNAENDLTTKGGDASDVLRRVPMLTVDFDGNVSLRGNQNIQVLINNKPSTIIASNIGDALKQIPADQIKTVEVITSPSARYDAEGSAGIINIITKKNTLQGLTLNIDAGVGVRGSNLGLNGNYRRKKMGFSLGGFGRANYNITGQFQNRQTTTDPESGVSRTNVQSADTENRGLFGNYTVGWDYDINDKNFMTASVRFGLRNMRREQNNFLTELYDNDGNLLNSSLAEVLNRDRNNNVDASVTYTRLFEKKQKELSFQGQFSRNNQNSNFLSNFISGTSIRPDITNENESYNQEMTLQVDYQTPIGENQMFEIGGKDIMRKVFSDFSNSNTANNNLNYDQNVLAAYMSYTRNFTNGFAAKAGTRYEYTTITAFSRTEDNIEIPSYGVIVPSLNLSKKVGKASTIKASYNRRIQRPSIRFLNPNIQWQNEVNYTIGNPRLDPEFTNNFELGLSTAIKGTSLNFTAFMRNTNDAIQSIREPYQLGPEEPVGIRTTYDNIGEENAYGASVFANVNIGKLTLNGGGDLYYASLDNNAPDEQFRLSNEGWVASGRLFGSYKLNKGWAMQFFGFGRGRSVQLQGTQGNFRMYSIGVRKEFNEKRGSIGIAGENFLQSSLKIRNELSSPELNQVSVIKLNNAGVRLTFSYRIGKMTMDQRPVRRRSISNDDLKDGGGDGGGMDTGATGMNGGGRTGAAPTGGQRPMGAQRTAPQKQLAVDTAAVVNPEGTWSYTVDSPQGGGGNFVIRRDGETLTGTISNNRSPRENQLNGVTLNGNELSFSYEVNMGGNSMIVTVKGVINGEEFTGNMTAGQFGSFPINAKRTP
jgi:outer membrane receptor for ferrienterochelin and colicin